MMQAPPCETVRGCLYGEYAQPTESNYRAYLLWRRLDALGAAALQGEALSTELQEQMLKIAEAMARWRQAKASQ